MPRYFVEVSYKGTAYSGFQEQQNAVTVQAEVEAALSTCFSMSFALTGASRTDAGVHALQNYFHFDTEHELFIEGEQEVAKRPMQPWLYSLNSILPGDVVIKRVFRVGEEAHCRFDARSRRYKYFIYRKKNPFYRDTAYFYPYHLDYEKLEECAAIILDTENFASFSKRNTQVKNFICTVYKSEWHTKNNYIFYEVTANRFLRGMVRGLVGTMLKVGRGRVSIDGFKEIIASYDCAQADFSVPAKGLFLVEIKYDIF